MLAYLDGRASASTAARRLQVDLGGFNQLAHRHAMKFIDNLLTLGLIKSASSKI